MMPKFWLAIRISWLFACVATLVLTLIYHGPGYSDAETAEALIMIGLSFPIGWLFAYWVLGTVMPTGHTELVRILQIWIPLAVIGYLQWFVLVPLVVRRLRRQLNVNA